MVDNTADAEPDTATDAVWFSSPIFVTEQGLILGTFMEKGEQLKKKSIKHSTVEV